ncbi:cellulase family glycosylhydrolase [Fibrobacter sp. UWR2]|jgi:endoglucanase|uniref:cellulase family glycosylhydrolase n=1 Tax=Fibrobacter sp. UWR2 TaxID=1964352 RepID=UPI001303E01D|nr:cellulase family glycosylhydrolase [Fibrobacter sp. UWR2]
MKHLLFTSLALVSALTATTFAQTITPTRVGPVSQYGQLMTGKNSQGKGQIYGSCEGVKDGAEVQVRGMSLYWSLMPQAVEYWSEEGVSTMVRDMNIQIVRAAMATGNEDWSNGYKGYGSDPTTQMNLMKTVVEAAIKNDIYVIIDWHSHNANEQTNSAKDFFSKMAQEYGKYDNVIFELFNEPTDVSWNTIKTYADQVVSAIREHSDNLILVGTPRWDQNPHAPIGNEVNDPKKNTAYTLHYYANSHCWSGSYDWSDPTWGGDCEGTKGEKAMNAGLSVFVSEWGTANSDGNGNPDQSRNQSWQDYMNKHKLSWANWSASYISEGTAAFQNGSSKTSLQYTTSGNLVKGYLSTNPTTYKACHDVTPESSSSSVIAIPFFKSNDQFSVSFANGKLALESSASGATKIEVFDLLGNTRLQKEESLSSGSHLVDIGALPAGSYLARVRQGANIRQVRFDIR